MPFSCCMPLPLTACFGAAFAFCGSERLALATCFGAALTFCGCERLAVAALGAAFALFAFCGCERLVPATARLGAVFAFCGCMGPAMAAGFGAAITSCGSERLAADFG